MRIAFGVFVPFFLSNGGAVHAFALARPYSVRRGSPYATANCLNLRATSFGDERPEVKPDILDPFPPAADPLYSVQGPVGEEDFALTRSGPPVAEELTNENLLRILRIKCSDLEVSTMDVGLEVLYVQEVSLKQVFPHQTL